MNAKQNDTNLSNSRKTPFIVDTTLRDGEQSPGIVFSKQEKQTLLNMMLKSGIREFEVGIPIMDDSTRDEIISLCKIAAEYSARAICWARCRKDDIAACKTVGADAIHLSLPVSDLQMTIMGLNRTQIIDKANRIIKIARDTFPFVSVGAQDATRAEPEFLMRYIETVNHLGVDRIRLADTVGCANPMNTHTLIQSIKERFTSIEVEFHAHNDFGMATANSIAAIQAGADAVSTTILGIGERAGNASLETVVCASKELLGIDLGVNSTHIFSLCDYVSKISSTHIPPHQPIVGDKVLTHESGIHTHGQLHHPKAYQPILAEQIGRSQPQFRFGTHSGKSAVIHLLRSNAHLVFNDAIADHLVSKIKQVTKKSKSSLSANEVLELAERIQGFAI